MPENDIQASRAKPRAVLRAVSCTKPRALCTPFGAQRYVRCFIIFDNALKCLTIFCLRDTIKIVKSEKPISLNKKLKKGKGKGKNETKRSKQDFSK